jgi:hypothetical protein
MSALSAIEVPVITGAVVPDAVVTGARPPRQSLRLVPSAAAGQPRAGTGGPGQPRASSIAGRRYGSSAAAVPVRLTRRGQIVVTALAVVIVTVAVLLIGLLASGGAQASNQGQPGGGYQGMHQIVVRQGQTLWSIAAAAEPTADPRAVIQQMVLVNALGGTDIQAGQLLWVPS